MRTKLLSALTFVFFFSIFWQFQAYLYGLFASSALSLVVYLFLKMKEWDNQRTKKKLHKLVERI